MSGPEVTRAAEVQRELAALRSAAAGSSHDPQRLSTALQRAALLLCDTREPLALRLRSELHAETGLSAPMIEWGLLTGLTSLRHAPLSELASALPAGRPREVIGVVLAGNVFVAALRALALPLLAGAHVVAKTASRESAFARGWRQALAHVDPEIGARLSLVHFSREDHAASAALCAGVDALSVYGDDETIAQLRAQLAPGARLIAHGHGLSAAYVARSQLSTPEQAARAAERVALDIAAYDQHGCLSPHCVCVEPGGAVSPEAFAQLLASEALPSMARLLPPRAPNLSERADQLQWQAAAAIRGSLDVHPSHAVSVEPAPLRPSPGGRQVGVYRCADPAQLIELLAPLATHLKSLGVAGSQPERAAIARALHGLCAVNVCQAGEMQTPAFDAWADGRAPLAGLYPAR